MTQQFIDVDKLERELVSALEADRKYTRENDAKFRAVHQKVATYEEFRDIVKASHLTCLDREDLTGQKERKQPWNPVVAQSKVDVPHSCHGDTVPAQNGAQAHSQPSTVHEFVKGWKRLKGSPKEQYRYLLSVGGRHLYEIFKVEISMGLLGEFLMVLNQCLTQTEDCDAVMEILKQLSRCSRFKLSLGFLAKDEKTASEQLLEKLQSYSDNDTSADFKVDRTTCLQELNKIYARSKQFGSGMTQLLKR